jgi:apolipoprotein N-acyltransferase
LICYEAIFPGEVVDETNRPQWLINVTNDAWFGISSGPHQHFASARMRAVEEGLPLVRAANTGVSGVIDPYGRVLARLGLDRAGVVEAPLPGALPKTPFAQFGNVVALTLAAACFFAAFSWRRA